VNWGHTGETYSEEQLKQIFSGFGLVEQLLIGKTGKNAVVLFETVGPALACERAMKNHTIYKFEVSLANKTNPQNDVEQTSTNSTPSNEALLKAHEEFEKVVLEKMRQAAQRAASSEKTVK